MSLMIMVLDQWQEIERLRGELQAERQRSAYYSGRSHDEVEAALAAQAAYANAQQAMPPGSPFTGVSAAGIGLFGTIL